MVRSDGCVELDLNRYSVPWRLIGAAVTRRVSEGEVAISHAGAEVARHGERRGRRERSVLAEHLEGIVGAPRRPAPPPRPWRPPRHRPNCCGPCPDTSGCWEGPGDGRGGGLDGMLARLKLSAVRERLDNLLDEAGRRELSLCEGLALLCQAETAHREERRIQTGTSIAKFPFVHTLEGFDFDAQPSLDPKQGFLAAFGDRPDGVAISGG